LWFEAACSAQDALAFEGLAFEHQHLNTATLAWEGKEKKGLVPGRRLRPDGIVQVDGKVTDVLPRQLLARIPAGARVLRH
jgi:hypothetical protein